MHPLQNSLISRGIYLNLGRVVMHWTGLVDWTGGLDWWTGGLDLLD